MIVPGVAVLCYVVSFCLPALRLARALNSDGTIGNPAELGRPSNMVGLAAFINGIFGVFMGQFAWLANPLAGLAIILILCRAYRASLIAAILAVLVAQHTWAVVNTTISGDEGGVTKYLVTGLGAGFYLWCASFVILAVGAIVAWMQSQPPALPVVAAG
jgi:hypothetical protein